MQVDIEKLLDKAVSDNTVISILETALESNEIDITVFNNLGEKYGVNLSVF